MSWGLDSEDIKRTGAMSAEQDFDARGFLRTSRGDELFVFMQELEEKSENVSPKERNTSDVLAKIALVETAIEDRFPGQLLAPYKDLQQRRTDI